MRSIQITGRRILLVTTVVLAVALVAVMDSYSLEGLMNLVSKSLLRLEGFYVQARNYSTNEMRSPTLRYDDGIVGTTNSLLAFTSSIAYSPGEQIQVYVKAFPDARIRIIDPSHDRKVLGEVLVDSLKPSSAVTFYRKSQGFDLKEFAKRALSTIDMGPGWYNIEVNSSHEVINLPVLIRDVKKRKILFVESTDTLKAYHSYRDLPTYYSEVANRRDYHWRPNMFPLNYRIEFNKNEFPCRDHLIMADHFLKKLLSVAFGEFDVVEDNFLDSFANIADYELIVFGAHNEYWSSEKFSNIKKFFGKGGSFLFLGGNVAWRYSLRREGSDIIDGGGVYLPSHQWIHEIIGNKYSKLGFNTYAGFQIASRDHFLIGGVPAEFGGASSFTHCGRLAASGQETDKISSPRFVHLARGKNGKGKGADIVFLERTESSGSVLNFGSVSLVHAYEDEGLVKLLSNYASYLNL